jgi:uncharacterized protein (DUF1330 family)
MTAYWISVYQEIFDQGKVDAYAQLARPALEAAGGTFVARGLPEQTYEAGEATRTVVFVFDSVEAARAAHDSLAYQEALAALDGGARRDMRILPALSPLGVKMRTDEFTARARSSGRQRYRSRC